MLKMFDDYSVNRAMAAGKPKSEDEHTARLIASGQTTFGLECATA